MIIIDDNQQPNLRATNVLPESPDTPSWGPPSASNPDMIPDTPSWGPPVANNPDMIPDTPSWGPPIGGGVIVRPWPPTGTLPDRPSSSGNCNIRFLYAAVDHPPISIQLGRRTVIRNFQYANITPYYLESSGNNKSIVITNTFTGATLYRGQFSFRDGYAYTVAVINNGSGISLFSMIDAPCQNAGNMGCIRAVNLSPDSGPVDVFLSGLGRVFPDVDAYSASSYRQVRSGTYRAFVSEALPCANNASVVMGDSYVECNNTRNIIMDSAIVNVSRGVLYTLFIIGRAHRFPALQILPAESDLVY